MNESTRGLGAAFIVLLGACGGGTGDNSDGSTMGTGSDGFSLAVNSAAYFKIIKMIPPANGRVYLQTNVTIKNDSASVPVLASEVLFSATTASGLSVMSTAKSELLPMPCTTDLSVIKGGMLTCNLVFEVPMGDTPVNVVYRDPTGRTASASIPAPTAVPLMLPAGPYGQVSTLNLTDGCNTGTVPMKYVRTLAHDAVSDFVFNEVADPRTRMPLVAPRVGNAGVVTYQGMAPGVCTYNFANEWDYTATADNELDYKFTQTQTNIVGNCKGMEGCVTTFTLHLAHL